MKLHTLDLFAGIGGIALGLERTGLFETAAFCEIDPKAQAVLKKNWPSVPVFGDVTTLRKEDLPDIDIITGGFPCQDISLAGRGGGLEAARSGLWFEFLRLIDEVRPKAALIENVSALRNRGLDQVLRGLASVGYDAEWHAIPAAAVGAPHRRDRLWIMAYPNGGGIQPEREPRDVASSSGTELGERQERERDGHAADHRGPDVADASCGRCRRPEARQMELSRRAETVSSGPYLRRGDLDGKSWLPEPDVGRVAHGVPGRVDRLKQLGNAVVPQVVTAIGPALYAAATR